MSNDFIWLSLFEIAVRLEFWFIFEEFITFRDDVIRFKLCDGRGLSRELLPYFENDPLAFFDSGELKPPLDQCFSILAV